MKNKAMRAVALLLAVWMAVSLTACGKEGNTPDTPGNTAISGESTTDADSSENQPGPYKATDKLIALTFDDGPYPSTTGRILDCLQRNNAKATFFVVGYNAETYVDTMKRAQTIGCEIGSHTLDHKILTKVSADEIRNQVGGMDDLLQSELGNAPALFRAPGGEYSGVGSTIGKPIVLWNIDTEDWKYKDAAKKGRSEAERNEDLNRIADSVFESAKAGDIILMHDIYEFSADLAEIVIPGLIERGFILCTVSEMFASYGYTLENCEVYHSADPAANNTVAVAKGTYTVTTNGSVLLLRADATVDSEKLERIPNGTVITVTDSKPGWAYTSYNGQSGWVKASYITACDDE